MDALCESQNRRFVRVPRNELSDLFNFDSAIGLATK